MGEVQDIDVEQIMEWLRDDIKKRRQPHSAEPKTSHFLDDELAADYASLHTGYDIYNLQFTSHRRIFGPLIILLKKILRQLLTPILTHQVSYNATNTRVATRLGEQLAALGHQAQKYERLLTTEDQTVQALQAQLTAQAEGIQALQARLTEFGQQMCQQEAMLTAHVEAMQERLSAQMQSLNRQQKIDQHMVRERMSRAERKLRRVLYVLTADQAAGERRTIEPKAMPRQAFESNFDYFGWEERFRGSEEDIKVRQQAYLGYFKGQNDILDIGCGRGEFLELLGQAGIKGKGVDLDLDMVLHCREKGLDVVHDDGLAYLDSLPEETLGGIFGAQVVEHLESKQIIEMVQLCRRKLRSGGILVLETPNPKCLVIFAESFYTDFSRIKPIHPEAMKFLFESTGFLNIELKFSAPVESSKRISSFPAPNILGTTSEMFNRSLEQLNELLYGFRDYAVIGRKPPC
jgi:SAM-dependent methyltransferase